MAAENDILRVVINYEAPNASAQQNVFNFIVANASALDSDVMDSVEDWATNTWGAAWQQIGSNQTDLVSADVSIISAAGTLLENLGTIVLTLSGLANADTVSAAVAGLLVAETQTAGIRGKKYVPNVVETQVANGAFNALGLANLADLFLAWNTITSIVGGASLVPVVLSRATQTVHALNNSGYTDDVPAYQRRRKPEVGV